MAAAQLNPLQVERRAVAGGLGQGPSIVVVGAGVVGVATAYALARRGAQVTLVDREAAAGQGASFANGAQLSYVYTDALASPALLRKAPGLLLGLEPGFRLHARLDPDHLRWLLAFLRNASAARFRANTLAGLALGLESMAAMHALQARHALDFAHASCGKLHLYDDERALRAARTLVELKARHGADQRVLTPAEAIGVEPALQSRTRPLAGAVYSPQDEVGDPYRFCQAMIALLRSDYGVRVAMGSPVVDVAFGQGVATVCTAAGNRLLADQVVVCAGADAGGILARAGSRVDLLAMKGYSLTLPRGKDTPRASLTDVSRRLVLCALGDEVRIAGLAELGLADRSVDATRSGALLDAASEILPMAADYARAGQPWAGLRPMTPTSLPVIRRIHAGLACNVGHGMLGWTYAMGSADRLARLVLGDQS